METSVLAGLARDACGTCQAELRCVTAVRSCTSVTSSPRSRPSRESFLRAPHPLLIPLRDLCWGANRLSVILLGNSSPASKYLHYMAAWSLYLLLPPICPGPGPYQTLGIVLFHCFSSSTCFSFILSGNRKEFNM